MKMHITDCSEGSSTGLPPKSLKDLGVGRILNRKIICWSESMGTYGMGGLGFFGMRLSSTQEYPKEWLVLTAWDSTKLVRFDGKMIDSPPRPMPLERWIAMAFIFPPLQWILLLVVILLYRVPRYLRGWPGLGEWDNLSGFIVGSKITTAIFTADSTKIQIRKKGNDYIVGFCTDFSKRDEEGKMRILESHLGAWVISKSGDLWSQTKPNPSPDCVKTIE